MSDKMDEKKLKKFEEYIKDLPETEQNRAILVINERVLSWKDMLEELKKGNLADEIERKLEELSR